MQPEIPPHSAICSRAQLNLHIFWGVCRVFRLRELDDWAAPGNRRAAAALFYTQEFWSHKQGIGRERYSEHQIFLRLSNRLSNLSKLAATGLASNIAIMSSRMMKIDRIAEIQEMKKDSGKGDG